MRKLKVFFTAIIVLLILQGMPTAGEIYKWVDKNGVIHLKDTPPPNFTPSMNIETIPIYEYDSQEVQDSEPAAEKNTPDSNIASSISVQPKKRKTPRVELYTTNWCFYCKKHVVFFGHKESFSLNTTLKKIKVPHVEKNDSPEEAEYL